MRDSLAERTVNMNVKIKRDSLDTELYELEAELDWLLIAELGMPKWAYTASQWNDNTIREVYLRKRIKDLSVVEDDGYVVDKKASHA